jgi:hypothetical protein
VIKVQHAKTMFGLTFKEISSTSTLHEPEGYLNVLHLYERLHSSALGMMIILVGELHENSHDLF